MTGSRVVGSVTYEQLLADVKPKPITGTATIKKTTEETEFKRATVFAKSSVDGKLVILGTAPAVDETLTADCVLCDDIKVGTVEDVNVLVYKSASVNKEALIVKDSYTMTEADIDNLRMKGIFITGILD